MKIKYLKIFKKIKENAIVKGELNASRHYRGELKLRQKEHDRQVSQLVNAHKREVKLIEKEYNVKAGQLDRKIKRLDALIIEWEKRVTEMKEIQGQSQELLAGIKQIMYQDRKRYANLLDDEKTMESLERSFNTLIQRRINGKVPTEAAEGIEAN